VGLIGYFLENRAVTDRAYKGSSTLTWRFAPPRLGEEGKIASILEV